MASKSGLTIFDALSLCASHIPKGRPIIRQNSNEVSTNARVIIASDHAPIAPIKISEIKALIPITLPESCHAISENKIIATGAGIEVRKFSKPPNTKSTGTRIPWKIGRKCSTIQSIPSVTQESSGISV